MYSISSSVIESSKYIITPILSHIINLCIKDGYFPEELKVGCITPIFKSGNKEIVSNYRSVCSLNLFSKIIEKVIFMRIISFIDKHNILKKTQNGFRKGMSTETALIDYINTIQNGLDNKQYTISIMMDLS